MSMLECMAQSAKTNSLRRRDQREALRYIGDSIAHSLFQPHEISAVSKGERPGPGFIFGKTGLRLEWSSVQAACVTGFPALLNDLTHCCRIGDVSVATEDGLQFFECKSPNQARLFTPRTQRQAQRLAAVAELLAHDRVDLSPAERFSLDLEMLPSALIECPVAERVNVAAFIECLRPERQPNHVVAEPGLIYLSWRPGDDPTPILREMPWGLTGMDLLMASLSDRIAGRSPYVRPVINLDAPAEPLRALLAGELCFHAIVDLASVTQGLLKRGADTTLIKDETLGPIWHVKTTDDMDLQITSRRLEHVLYGIESLEANLDVMAQVVRRQHELGLKGTVAIGDGLGKI